MIILGIDPGTATMGYGVITHTGRDVTFVDCGVIQTSKHERMADRLVIIAKDLRTLIKRHKPDVVAVEELFFAKNVTNALTVGQARGVVLLIAAEAGCEIAEYKPHQVKQAISSYGRATKQQMQQMVQTILSLAAPPTPDDAADALAVAITHANSMRSGTRIDQG